MKLSEVIAELARQLAEYGDKELPEDFWIREENGDLKIE